MPWEYVAALGVWILIVVAYGDYRSKQRARNLADEPPPDFEKPSSEGDLL